MNNETDYQKMIFIAHSFLQSFQELFIYNKNSTVDDFRNSKVNNDLCDKVFNLILEKFNYELSYNQMENAIHLFLKHND